MITNPVNRNPWRALPLEPPYILPGDAPFVEAAGKRAQGLRFDVLPDPYVGNPSSAKAILLVLNPGFIDADVELNMQHAGYIQTTRANMLHTAQPPFFYFDDYLSFCGGNTYWSRILKPLIETGISKQQLAADIANIQYLPYHSTTYRDLGRILPSQEYSFELVRQAIRDHKPIVIMRSKKLWLQAVPELATYDYMRIKNPRNPVLSPANLGDVHFQRLRTILGS